MSLFVIRYVCTLFIFVLGLKAPGIKSVAAEDEQLLVDDENVNEVSLILIQMFNPCNKI